MSNFNSPIREQECPICNGDCANANPPVLNCPKECDHPWADQDKNGRPYCAVCRMPWAVVESARAELDAVEQLRKEDKGFGYIAGQQAMSIESESWQMSIEQRIEADHIAEIIVAIKLGLNRLEAEMLRKAGNVPRRRNGVHRVMKKLRAQLDEESRP